MFSDLMKKLQAFFAPAHPTVTTTTDNIAIDTESVDQDAADIGIEQNAETKPSESTSNSEEEPVTTLPEDESVESSNTPVTEITSADDTLESKSDIDTTANEEEQKPS